MREQVNVGCCPDVKCSVKNMNDSSDQRSHVDDGKRDLSQIQIFVRSLQKAKPFYNNKIIHILLINGLAFKFNKIDEN